MTLTSNYNQVDHSQFRKTVGIINQIIKILGEFKKNYEKRLNFSKLADILKIPHSEVDDIINLLFNFQSMFENTFLNYRIKKKREKGQIFLVVEKKDHYPNMVTPRNIVFTQSQVKLFNDIIYMFKFVNRGKGFDISNNGTELLTNLKDLAVIHPYLFEMKEQGLIYPSPIGLKLGELILSFNKGNKQIKTLDVENHTVVVMNDE